MNSSQRRERYSYKLSFADEVGSSFDPDMEDVALWEHELAGTLLSRPVRELQSDFE